MLAMNVKCLSPLVHKMLSVTFCEYMDSERYAYLNTSGGHKLCKVNKPHRSFISKLFELFPKSTTKAIALPLLIQPPKRTTTYGLRSFQYYGAHVWNMLPVNLKAAQSLRDFKSLIRSWPGPTCSCQLCVALL